MQPSFDVSFRSHLLGQGCLPSLRSPQAAANAGNLEKLGLELSLVFFLEKLFPGQTAFVPRLWRDWELWVRGVELPHLKWRFGPEFLSVTILPPGAKHHGTRIQEQSFIPHNCLFFVPMIWSWFST